jgi:hypothetical protein
MALNIFKGRGEDIYFCKISELDKLEKYFVSVTFNQNLLAMSIARFCI